MRIQPQQKDNTYIPKISSKLQNSVFSKSHPPSSPDRKAELVSPNGSNQRMSCKALSETAISSHQSPPSSSTTQNAYQNSSYSI